MEFDDPATDTHAGKQIPWMEWLSQIIVSTCREPLNDLLFIIGVACQYLFRLRNKKELFGANERPSSKILVSNDCGPTARPAMNVQDVPVRIVMHPAL